MRKRSYSEAREINKALIDQWCDEDNLILLEGWARDGFTMVDIANRIGIDLSTLSRWKRQREEIADALKNGNEIVDYKVENALLKSALGYKTKETTVRVLMRGGIVIEKEKTTTTKEQAPNVYAIQTWLYNRKRDKWKNMNSRANIIDDLEEDTNIQITVTRAKANELEEEDNWESEVNESIELRKSTEEEKEQKIKERKKKQKIEKENKKTKILYEDDENE